MSDFAVRVIRLTNDTENHPNADRLSLMNIDGKSVVSNKVEGNHRYNKGDLIVYVPVGSFVPDALLKDGFWDKKNDKAGLGGETGNIVEPFPLRGVTSEGIIFPVINRGDHFAIKNTFDAYTEVSEGDNVADVLGITRA